MKEIEKSSINSRIVIISDVQLDKPLVLEKLRKIFSLYENNNIDLLFILMGSFISKPISRVGGGRTRISEAFAGLGELIAQFERLSKQAKWVFVPGAIDAGNGVAMPRRPIPDILTDVSRSSVCVYVSSQLYSITFIPLHVQS